MKKEQKICFLSGLPIGPNDFSVEHYCPKSRVPAQFANAKANKYPAIKIINFIKGDLLPCEWRLLYSEKMQYAVNNWNLKAHARKIIMQALNRLLAEKKPESPCQHCILRTAPGQCYESRNMAGYHLILTEKKDLQR